eukprot:TRINITY_DN11308_c0_g1_i4.p2 TRINITY_DN11308_c0_g1~~TRINITY_DN11308_c0_g1_i4.p2  ORF type:complete len:395 (+),score=63.27 TRINITY_DN11308_c0_g1_i4:80-1186(+)
MAAAASEGRRAGRLGGWQSAPAAAAAAVLFASAALAASHGLPPRWAAAAARPKGCTVRTAAQCAQRAALWEQRLLRSPGRFHGSALGVTLFTDALGAAAAPPRGAPGGSSLGIIDVGAGHYGDGDGESLGVRWVRRAGGCGGHANPTALLLEPQAGAFGRTAAWLRSGAPACVEHSAGCAADATAPRECAPGSCPAPLLPQGEQGCIRLLRAAASDREGAVSLQQQGLTARVGGGSGAAELVPATTVDAIGAAMRNVTLVKIDAEGHELPVLHGMRRLLAAGSAAAVVIEVADWPGGICDGGPGRETACATPWPACASWDTPQLFSGPPAAGGRHGAARSPCCCPSAAACGGRDTTLPSCAPWLRWAL